MPIDQNEVQVQYAGFWVRLVAYVIDSVIFAVILGLVFFFIGRVDEITEMLINLLGLFAWALYLIIMHASSWQATVGKRILGIKVVDEYGDRISLSRSTGRFFSEFLSTILLMIGYLMIGFHRHKRGLHDIIAGTFVIKND